MRNKYLIWLLVILLLGLFIRIITINYEWIDVDEGNYLSDAKLLAENLIPFKDFYMKEVLYTLSLSLFGKLFGFSLFFGRFLSVIFSIATIFFVYKIGSLLHDKRLGVIAAGIYAFIPFAIFWNNLIRESVLMIMLFTIAVYYIIKFTKTNNFLHISLHTFFLFLALLTRRSIILFVLAEIFLLAYMYRNETKILSRIFLYGGFGILLPLILLFLYSYVINADFLKLLGFEFLPFTSAFSLEQFIGQRVLLPYWFFREAPYITILSFIVLISRFKSKAKTTIISIFLFVILASAFAYEYLILRFPERMSQYPVTSNVFFMISIAYTLILFLLSFSMLKYNFYGEKQNKFILLWIFSIIAFYLFYSRFHVVYLAEIMPALAVISAPFLSRLDYKNLLTMAFFIVILIGVVLSAVFYVSYHGLNNKWSSNSLNDVASYVRDNSDVNDEIFTPLTMVPIMADRKLALDITHPLLYHFEGIGEDDAVGAPSFKTIIDYMDKNKVKYVVADDYMDVTYYSTKPDIKIYIENNYILEKKIGDILILRRKN